jgi:Nucleotidyl transferase AbiEii toxin, Type IV TA system
MALPKRVLLPQEQALLRETLQMSAISALMNARRWEPGDIVFQGGTSLHLAHGSARFSEDLDFMVRDDLPLHGLAKNTERWLRLPLGIAEDLRVRVSAIKDQRNPNVFDVTLAGTRVMGSARVKLEFWQTPARVLQSVQSEIATLRSTTAQAYVPTLTEGEIFTDKVYALGGRDRLKPRDVFDTWWLAERGAAALTLEGLRTRLQIYPAHPVASHAASQLATASRWLTNASVRLGELESKDAPAALAKDLQRWLPSTWPMNAREAVRMLVPAVHWLRIGIEQLQGFVKLRKRS